MINNSKRFNRLFLKRYKKSKTFEYDKAMIDEIYNLFVENYKTTGYIFDGSNISYLTNNYIKANNHTELPKNLNSACIYLKEISNIIYIFDKVLEFNFDMLAMDVIYNVEQFTGKTNVNDIINTILSLTGKYVETIYLIKRSHDIEINQFETGENIEADNFFMKIISIINKYIDEHDECKKNYEYVNYLSNKSSKKVTRCIISFFSKIKLFFKWLIFDDSVMTKPIYPSVNDGLTYKSIVECINYALNKLNDKIIVDIMFKYKNIPFEERFSYEMQNIFKKPSDEITSENNNQYIEELETIGKMVEGDYDNIKCKMHNSILDFEHYVLDNSLYLVLNNIYNKCCE